MQPKIIVLPEKKLVGITKKMSLAKNTTSSLWQSFMPFREHITNSVSNDLFSMQVYDSDLYFENFSPTTIFAKWAAVEVTDFNSVPEKLDSYVLQSGLYAVFQYKGLPSNFHQMFNYILTKWIPQSEYELEHREHFELLGEKYSNTRPESEEEIWIPIRPKN